MLFINISSAQNYKEDLKLMNKRYATLENFYTEMSMKNYGTATSKQPNFIQAGKIRIQNFQFYYTFDDMDMLINKKYSIMVDKKNKTIVYKKLAKAPKAGDQDLETIMPDFDKVMEVYDSVVYKGNKNGIKHYTIYPKMQFKSVELFLRTDGVITKLVYYYSQNATNMKKIVIEFNNSTITPTFSKNQFSEKKYFTISGSNATPANSYKNYKLLKVKDYGK
jgi:hypothetical protein